MNILFFFSDTLVGGAETNILRIAKDLSTSGYTIYFASFENNGPLLDNLQFDLKRYICTGLPNRTPRKTYLAYGQLIREGKIDVVLNFGLRVELFSRIVSKKLGVQRVISNIRSTDDWRKFHHVLMDRLTQSAVDVWVSNSEKARQVFHGRERIPLSKILVIHNFIDLPQHTIWPARSVPTSFSIGVLANITPAKGYFDLIGISKNLTQRGISHVFHYAGIDKTDGAFAAKVSEEGVRTTFNPWGYINESQKALFFESIDVLILPSYLEGLPTVLLEAMAHGVAVVTTNVGGIPEIIEHGKNGMLHHPGDISGMASSLEKLANNVSLREELQRAALHTVIEKFSRQAIIGQWKNVLTELVRP